MEPSEKIIKILSKPDTRLKFRDLMRATRLSKAELLICLAEARKLRPDLLYGKFDKTYWLSNTPTWYSNQTDLSLSMDLEGEFGVLTDTHLCSVAERLDLVEQAYSYYESRGISKVFHCGDLTDGWKEYKHHINFVKVHGDQEQAKYVIEKYPFRQGITTYVIGGNHDDSYGASKIDRLSLIVNGFHHNGKTIAPRNDIIYLGQYSHYLIFPEEVRIHLLHPRGNNAYSMSYKQQKRAEAFTKNEQPDIQLSGHFHTFCHIWHDGTHLISLPGVQDETEYFKRLGLPRSLGFGSVQYKIQKGRFQFISPCISMHT